MRQTHGIPLGRLQEHIASLPAPERTAYRAGVGIFSDYTFQTWPNRESMARSIRMQQRRASHATDWKAVQPLSDGEGY